MYAHDTKHILNPDPTTCSTLLALLQLVSCEHQLSIHHVDVFCFLLQAENATFRGIPSFWKIESKKIPIIGDPFLQVLYD